MAVSERRELTFPIAMDRVVMWLIAGLVAWLCVSTMGLREQMAVVMERGENSRQDFKIVHEEMERLTNSDKKISESLKELELKQAQHGWN
jgi:hypothetical protein